MPSEDLLSTIRDEIQARLDQLRPLVSEYEQLEGATDALELGLPSVSHPARRRAPAAGRAPAKATSKAARAAAPTGSPVDGGNAVVGGRAAVRSTPAPARPRRGSASTAILAALEHGSHTTSELTTVSGLSATSIRRDVQGLLTAGAIQKVERDGRTAYALSG